MTPNETDRHLARLRAAADRVGKNLVDTENDPIWHMLGHAALEGDSAVRYADGARALAEVWRWYGELTELAERATDLRGSKRGMTAETEAALQTLLAGPSIELASGPVPLGDRDLFGASREVRRATADDLLGLMAASFDRVRAVIADAGRAWDSYVRRLTEARSQFAAVVDAAGCLGDGEPSTLVRARAQLQVLAERLVGDPLAVTEAELEAVEADIAGARAEIGAAVVLRAHVGGRLADAEARLAQLDGAVDAAVAAHREATVKIAGARASLPADGRGDLRDRLQQIAALTEAGDWRDAQELLAEWTGRVDDLLDRARACERHNRTLIEARNELRARLDAYRVKADRLGRIEEPAVSDAYVRAEACLYTAPTDLDAAARLVTDYQGAVSASAAESVAR
jgi:hypothetical protein